MTLEKVSDNLYRQKSGTKLTARDLIELAESLHNHDAKPVEVTVDWSCGPSVYGFNLDTLEKEYNVKIILE